MSDYPVEQIVHIELYGLNLEVHGYVEPAQDGGRTDPSWDAYWVTTLAWFLDEDGDRLATVNLDDCEKLGAIDRAVEDQMKSEGM